MTASASTPSAPPRGFFQRRLLDPIRAQLTQGTSPERVAFTLAVGTACSMFPFLGFTALLNLGVGLCLRLNQPILQTLNQLLGPVHLVMIVVYVRIGERLYLADGDSAFSLSEMLRIFREETFVAFLQRFGLTGLHAFTAWAISVPLIIACIYFPLRRVLLATRQPPLRKLPD